MTEIHPPDVRLVGMVAPEYPMPRSNHEPMPHPRDPELEPKPFHA